MTSPSVYQCPDGTKFPVTWEQPDDVLQTWRWDQEHQPEPMKPLELAIGNFTRPGAARAFEDAEVPMPALFRGGRIANGFLFMLPQENAVLPPDEQAALHAAVERLIEREGGVWQVWERFCLPRVETSAANLRRADDGASFAEIGELLGYGMRMTHVAGSFSLFAPIKHEFSEFAKEVGK